MSIFISPKAWTDVMVLLQPRCHFSSSSSFSSLFFSLFEMIQLGQTRLNSESEM